MIVIFKRFLNDRKQRFYTSFYLLYNEPIHIGKYYQPTWNIFEYIAFFQTNSTTQSIYSLLVTFDVENTATRAID